MAFPTTSIIDDFNRANGGWGAAWTTDFGDAAPVIVSNQGASSGVGWSGATYNTTYAANQEVYFTVPVSADNRVVVYSRYASTNGYALDINTVLNTSATANFNIARVTGGALSTLVNVRQDVSSGDGIGFSVVGSTITAYYKSGAGAWTQVLQTTDATHNQSGKIGIEIFNNVQRIDDFGGGAVVSLPSDTPFPPAGRGASW